MPRIGGIAAAANRARQAKALASAQAKKKRSSNAATLIELHREFFESLSPKQYEKVFLEQGVLAYFAWCPLIEPPAP